MGLFDKLLDKGAKALGDMVSDKLSDVVNGDNEIGETFRSVKSAVSSVTGANEQDTWEEPGSRRGGSGHSKKAYATEKSFEEKLRTIIQNAGNYEIKEDISPDELEQEYGREIYTRGSCYCEPENISYGIYQSGNRVLMIRLWCDYQEYNHMANRQIKDFCDANGVKMLDFFEYLPNEEDYMDQRIREQIV